MTSPGTLDVAAYPHILDLIVSFASPAALYALRGGCRRFLELADAQIFAHVVISPRRRDEATQYVSLVAPWVVPAGDLSSGKQPDLDTGSSSLSDALYSLARKPKMARLPCRWEDPYATRAEHRRWAAQLRYTRVLDYASEADLTHVPVLAAALAHVPVIRRLKEVKLAYQPHRMGHLRETYEQSWGCRYVVDAVDWSAVDRGFKCISILPSRPRPMSRE